ncbi:TolC family protein [Symbiobacterium terraclitae]|uniref:TolC family protein n=1 Tax=Symbiobacterium terraclitae TaxID=557451 RepID=UPI0035B50814
MRLPRSLVSALISLTLLTAAGPPAAAADTPPEPLVLGLEQALSLAETLNPGVRLTAIQVSSARSALETAPAAAPAMAPALTAYLQAQYGISIPQQAITPQTVGQQALLTYEQAASQHLSARQQVRAGALQAYVTWQKAVATVEAQQAALERTRTQLANVEAAVAVGSASQYDLLQVQAALAGQQAALIGAQAMEEAARSALGQVIGTPIAANVRPEPDTLRSEEVALPTDLESLIAQAVSRRPDLRDAALDLAGRRLQTGLSADGTGAAQQVQAAASQYELALARARAEVTQAYLAAHGALEELRAREKALEPAREALRLAELRYDAGLATWVEVQAASAAALEAEAGRIQAAANLRLRLLELRQALGEL